MVLMTEEELTKKYDIDEDRRKTINELIDRGVNEMYDTLWFTWTDHYKCRPESDKALRDEDFLIFKEAYLTALMHSLLLDGKEYFYAQELFELLGGFNIHTRDKIQRMKDELKEFKEQCLWDKEHGEESAED